MRCESNLRLLEAYVDAELESSEVAAVESHLRDCSACREQQLAVRALREAVQSNADYHRAPASLRRVVLEQIASREVRSVARSARSRWLTQALAAGVMTATASAITFQLAVPSAYELATTNVLSNHARS